MIAWGDVPTWTATLAAVAAGIYAARVFKLERDRDTAVEQAARQELASAVSAWISAEVAPMKDQDGRIVGHARVVNANIANVADRPVYALEAWTLRVRGEPQHFGVLPPQTTHRIRMSDLAVFPHETYSGAIYLEFFDGQRRFGRDCRTGELVELSDDDRGDRRIPSVVSKAWDALPHERVTDGPEPVP